MPSQPETTTSSILQQDNDLDLALINVLVDLLPEGTGEPKGLLSPPAALLDGLEGILDGVEKLIGASAGEAGEDGPGSLTGLLFRLALRRRSRMVSTKDFMGPLSRRIFPSITIFSISCDNKFMTCSAGSLQGGT